MTPRSLLRRWLGIDDLEARLDPPLSLGGDMPPAYVIDTGETVAELCQRTMGEYATGFVIEDEYDWKSRGGPYL